VSAVRFNGGVLTGAAPAAAVVYLRGATDWKFSDVRMVGTSLSGPTVDLDQSAGYGLDFSGCWLSATPVGSSPGASCIKVGGSPPPGSGALTYLKTDRINFLAGDTSIYFASAGARYSALDWLGDSTGYGPVAASGVAGADSLLTGRAGTWRGATVSSPWSGTPTYRVGPDGLVELAGNVTSSGGGGTIFTLGAGYYNPAATVTVPAATSAGTATLAIDTTGHVSASDPGTGNSLYLDGVAFTVN
jgi:hypothetical protein